MAAPEDPTEPPEAPRPEPPEAPRSEPPEAPDGSTAAETAPLPPAPDATTVEPPRWAARAQVPSRPAGREYADADQWAVEQPRSVLLPVLLTVIVMLLLGVFGVGIWLLLSNRPTPLPPHPPTETGTVSTTRATTPATTTATSATATTNTVPMPDIVDKPYAEAAAALAAVGLVPERHDEFSDTVPAETVIRADTPPGAAVPPGTIISVFVSKGPPPAATASATATATATTPASSEPPASPT